MVMKLALPQEPRQRAAAVMSLAGVALILIGYILKQRGFVVGWILWALGLGILFTGLILLPFYWFMDWLAKLPDWAQQLLFYVMFGAGAFAVAGLLFLLEKC